MRLILRATKARIAKLVPGARLHQTVAAGPLEGMVMLLPSGWEAGYTHGLYEPGVAAALSRLVRPGDSCVDAGAHYGYFTLLLSRVTVEQAAVAALEGQVELHPASLASEEWTLMKTFAHSDARPMVSGRPERTRAVRLDQYLASAPRID